MYPRYSIPGETGSGPTFVLQRGQTYEMEADTEFALFEFDAMRVLCSERAKENISMGMRS